MSAYDLIVATALLSAPVDTPEPVPSETDWPVIRDAIHKVAIEWEIMDERETRYVLANRDDFATDLNLLRKRRTDLADAPRLTECRRLPNRDAVNELIKFNRDYRKQLEERAVWEQDRAELIHQVIQETDYLYHQWDSVRDAQCDFYYVTVRRAALKKLRESIGQDAFVTSRMPPYVPYWRFSNGR